MKPLVQLLTYLGELAVDLVGERVRESKRKKREHQARIDEARRVKSERATQAAKNAGPKR